MLYFILHQIGENVGKNEKKTEKTRRSRNEITRHEIDGYSNNQQNILTLCAAM